MRLKPHTPLDGLNWPEGGVMTTSDREYFDVRFAQLETLIQKSVADGKAELHATIVSTINYLSVNRAPS
jgi:hypothetical protein